MATVTVIMKAADKTGVRVDGVSGAVSLLVFSSVTSKEVVGLTAGGYWRAVRSPFKGEVVGRRQFLVIGCVVVAAPFVRGKLIIWSGLGRFGVDHEAEDGGDKGALSFLRGRSRQYACNGIIGGDLVLTPHCCEYPVETDHLEDLPRHPLSLELDSLEQFVLERYWWPTCQHASVPACHQYRSR